MIRPQVEPWDDELDKRVNEYADRHGLRRPRAFHELLRKGLAVADYEAKDAQVRDVENIDIPQEQA